MPKQEPDIQGKYSKSVVVEREGRKIGIIGYVTTETLVSITSLVSILKVKCSSASIAILYLTLVFDDLVKIHFN